jgi:hypothetical protein
MAAKRFWRIIGYDSTKRIFEKEVPHGSMSEKQMADALRALASRAGLTFDEIVDCYLRTNAKGYRSLLEVQVSSRPKFSMSCGSNPHFIASVVER